MAALGTGGRNRHVNQTQHHAERDQQAEKVEYLFVAAQAAASAPSTAHALSLSGRTSSDGSDEHFHRDLEWVP